MSSSTGPCALVLGAGIQGTCTALALSRAGWKVSLIDRSPEPWSGASVRGEGKVHVGYVFANDATRATAALMLEGALMFAELLERWAPGTLDWAAMRSTPFFYGVMPDSLVSVDVLAEHYAWIDERIGERLVGGANYLGSRTFAPAKEVEHPCSVGLGRGVERAFATSEVAVDPGLLRRALIAALACRGVPYYGGHTVTSVARGVSGFAVTCTDAAGEAITHHADVVVNCLWDGRLGIDATMGIVPARPWVYRLKYGLSGVMAAGAPLPPSATFVLGPYGDVVQRAGGRVYTSWYPTCLAGWGSDLEVPRSWHASMEGADPDWVQDDIAVSVSRALAELVPAVEALRIDTVAAGVIVAWGATDIDEVDSELHRRHEIGVHDHDGYVSVDTGKLTTAPLFAQRVTDLLDR